MTQHTYRLYNHRSQVYLTHPRIGIWETTDQIQAEEMLASCQQYVKSLQIPDFEKNFVIISSPDGIFPEKP